MNKNITHDDLLLLAYDELEPSRRSYVITAMGSDSQLIADYEDIISTMEALNGLMLQPDNTSLQIILEESSSAMEVL